MKRITRLSATIGAVLSSIALPAAAGELHTAAQRIEGQYIVVLKPDAASLANERSSVRRVPEAARDIAAAHRARLMRSYTHALRGFAVEADGAALAGLLADPRVDYVEEDAVVSIASTQSSAPWGLDRVDQRDLPLSTTYTNNTSASGVHAYILDTGIRGTHTEFTGRIGSGFSAINDSNGTNDCNGHGTHVAGIVGGTTWGVAKDVNLHPVRVLACDGTGTLSGIIAGMDWVAANRVLPAVANMSFSGGASDSEDSAVNNLINSGVTVVVAAGNDAGDACQKSPARVYSALTVGSTDSNDTRASDSNTGTCLDMFAPGVGIMSAYINNDNSYATMSGTSMAAPHVAGAAALYLAYRPSDSPSQVASALIEESTLDKVTNAGLTSPNRLLYTGGISLLPVTTNFLCPDYNNSGSGTYWCELAYSSPAASATVRWPNGSSGLSYRGTCVSGSQPKVTVTVTNAYGSVSRSATFSCPMNPIP